MALENICGKLLADLDLSCQAPERRFWQQAVLINKSDVDTWDIITTDYDATPTVSCAYSVEFALKCEKKGIRISGIESGDSYKGWYSKTRADNGYPVYKHQVQLFIGGTSETINCVLDALDRGSHFVAMQTKGGTVVIYGFQNGLSSGDYDYDIMEGSGGTLITLESLDSSPESLLPLIYKAGGGSTVAADFDASFEGPSC